MKRQVAYNAVLQVMTKGVAYLAILLLANRFSKADYGLAFYALAFYYLISSILFLGLPKALVPFLTKKKGVKKLAMIFGGVSIIGMVIGFIFLPPWVRPLTFSLPFGLLHSFGLAYLIASHRHALFQGSYLIGMVITVISLFLLQEYGAPGILLAYSFGFIGSGLVVAPFIKRGSGRTIQVTEYISNAAPITIIGLAFMFLFWIDSVFLGAMSSSVEVARYQVVGSITSLMMIVPSAISLYLLARTSTLSESRGRPTLKKAMRISTMFTITASIVLISVLPLLLRLFFSKYIDVLFPTILLLIGTTWFTLVFLTHHYFMGIKKPNFLLFPLLVAVLINLTLDVLLIPSLGMFGAIIATVIAHGVTMVYVLSKLSLYREMLGGLILSIFFIAAIPLGYYAVLLLVIIWPLAFMIGLIKKEDLTKPST